MKNSGHYPWPAHLKESEMGTLIPNLLCGIKKRPKIRMNHNKKHSYAYYRAKDRERGKNRTNKN